MADFYAVHHAHRCLAAIAAAGCLQRSALGPGAWSGLALFVEPGSGLSNTLRPAHPGCRSLRGRRGGRLQPAARCSLLAWAISLDERTDTAELDRLLDVFAAGRAGPERGGLLGRAGVRATAGWPFAR